MQYAPTIQLQRRTRDHVDGHTHDFDHAPAQASEAVPAREATGVPDANKQAGVQGGGHSVMISWG